MADVRALLRQQRAARRITHPYAAYSDTGKLLCTLCRDQIRAESHWDAHLASDKHRKRLSTISAPPPPDVNGGDDDDDDYCVTDEVNEQAGMEDLNDIEGRHQRADTPSSTHKRKLDHAAAASKDERETDNDVDEEDEVRRKRSRHASPETGRRKPQGPSQGVQVQMPSRSTTPADSQHSGSSAAATAAAKSTTKLATSLPSRQASNLATPASSSSMSIQQEAPPQPQPQPQQPQTHPPQPPAASTSQNQQQIDEDEWAAFEADIAAETAPYDADAVISRPAMTAEEAAAAKEAAAAAAAAEQEALENPESRKTKADADIEDEREEATRALEEEFEEMQELEARVQRLKEKREALMRKRGETVSQEQVADDGVASLQAAATTKPSSDGQDEGKENALTTPAMNGAEAENSDEDDEDDDEEEEDDWDGFRFRTGR
ncbi:hypothetical protein M419DRAFT_12729 [Trichoderma reesei RUT C-30]|jgi:hypothetical protein|uniref:Coiled-coil domain-containing protein 16 n=1 Tax=Hypocrea jecorina (strain ATCC 56765 / BCRC 32924 / NRRL 11460 / Rut C-30) TaxID=1344414 RepID=A0A024RWM0_HYPJR|nr:hypothetical protein M419DRAFT_12729 [Trichoderma reesei RUT C-30]